jgi:hypothetical protein
MKTIIFFGCLVCFAFCNLAFAWDGTVYCRCANCGWSWNCQPAYPYQNIPYYALHPPVYYSYPVPRTYGSSPFQYAPSPPEIQNSSYQQPQIIKNEYVEESPQQADDQSQDHAPMRISNPFIQQSNNSAMSKGAKWVDAKTPRPLVIYPTATAKISNSEHL